MARKIIHNSNDYIFSNLEKEDLNLIKKWRNAQMSILRQNKKLSSADQKKWFNKVQEAKDQKIYSILNSKHELIGYCGLTNYDETNKRAEISFLVKPEVTENKYQDIFIESLKFLKNQAFNKYCLHKIFTETYEFRSKHIEILERNGFERTGVLKDHICERGNYYDSYVHSCIRENLITHLEGVPVLVTGGAGVIGKELIKKLIKLGAKVRCVDFSAKPSQFCDNVDYWRLDLSDPNSQFLFRFKPRYVFHLAADFERSTEDLDFWDSNFRNNVLASHYLLENVFKLPSLKKIIFASSYLIYDKNLYHDTFKINIINEESAINPRNQTGIAKLQTERDIEFFQANLTGNMNFANARIFRVYGRGSRDIISRWVRSALKKEKITVFGENNSFDYIHAWDVAQALISLALSNEANGVFNVASGKSRSIKQVLNILKSNFQNLEINTSLDEIYPESSQADISKISKLTDWKPKYDLETGIKDLIEYEKSNKK